MIDNEQDPHDAAELLGRLAMREIASTGQQLHDAATRRGREERELRIKQAARARYERRKAAGELPERRAGRRRGPEL